MPPYKSKRTCVYCKKSMSLTSTRCIQCGLFQPMKGLRTDILGNVYTNFYVLNLKKDKERYQLFQQRNQELYQRKKGVRFQGVDGNNLSEVKKALTYLNFTGEHFLEQQKKYPGNIGCYLSHLSLWKYIHEQHKSKYVLIFEDDAYFIPNGISNLEFILRTHSFQADFIYVGHNKIHGKRVHAHYSIPHPGNHYGYNSGLFGYLIRVSSIPKLLSLHAQTDDINIDVYNRRLISSDKERINQRLVGSDKEHKEHENVSAVFLNSNLIVHNDMVVGSTRKNTNIKK